MNQISESEKVERDKLVAKYNRAKSQKGKKKVYDKLMEFEARFL